MKPRGHLGEVPRQIDAADETRGGARHAHEPTAVGKRPLSEHVHVTGFIHHLGEQHVAGLHVVGRRLRDPPGRNVPSDELHLVEKRAEQAFGLLDVVGQRLHRLPGNVRRGAPLSLLGLLVQERCVLQPDLGQAADPVSAHPISVGPFPGSPWVAAHVVAHFRQLPVAADPDVFQGHAPLAGLGAGSPLAHTLHPARIELVLRCRVDCLAHHYAPHSSTLRYTTAGYGIEYEKMTGG